MRLAPYGFGTSLALIGCFGPSEGVEVPVDKIYFPVGVALDTSGEHLFVVSSDFDLQYNAGSIQSYRLAGVLEHVPLPCNTDADCGEGGACDANLCSQSDRGACGARGERPRSEQLLYPTRCNAIDPEPHIVSSVKVGAFATDALVLARPDANGAPERLFVPVRGDSTLHWLDVTEGELECGQQNNSGACDDAHRVGDDPDAENTRDLRLESEPYALAATRDGSALVVTNQTTGTASLFTNDWFAPPALKFALASDAIPSRPVGVANLPRSALSSDLTPDAFLLTFRNSAQVRIVRFAPDASSPARPYLVDGGGVTIDANSVGSDSRGIAIDASRREAAEARCGDDQECLEQAALVPLDVYVANRSPASLLVGRTRPPQEFPYFFQTVPLTFGPSRVVVGKVRTAAGELETRVFVVCFDSRRIFVYDPERERIETEIATGRGPHAIAVDEARARLYVGHFTDSFLGIFSLDLGFPATYGAMIGMLGTPTPPRSSK
jgi:hypothetical protein